MPRITIGIMNASEVPSIGLQNVVISTSSMHASVVSGFFSASISTSFSVDATSAFSTHEHSTGSAATAACSTFAFESLRHSITNGMHSGRHGPIVPGAFVASSAASCRHSIFVRPPPPMTCIPSKRAPSTAFTDSVDSPSRRARAARVDASATFLSLSDIAFTWRASIGMPYGSNLTPSVAQSCAHASIAASRAWGASFDLRSIAASTRPITPCETSAASPSAPAAAPIPHAAAALSAADAAFSIPSSDALSSAVGSSAAAITPPPTAARSTAASAFVAAPGTAAASLPKSSFARSSSRRTAALSSSPASSSAISSSPAVSTPVFDASRHASSLAKSSPAFDAAIAALIIDAAAFTVTSRSVPRASPVASSARTITLSAGATSRKFESRRLDASDASLATAVTPLGSAAEFFTTSTGMCAFSVFAARRGRWPRGLEGFPFASSRSRCTDAQ